MASPRSRPSGPLEQDGEKRETPANQRVAVQQSYTLHHSDDELFSARVLALVAERRRLRRQGLIHRLQHLKAAILSSELSEHHEAAEQSLMRSEEDRTGSHADRFSSPLRPRSPTASRSRLYSQTYDSGHQNASTESTCSDPCFPHPSQDEPRIERQTVSEEVAPLSHLALEANASETSRAERTDQDIPAVAPHEHKRFQFLQRRNSDPVLMHHVPGERGAVRSGDMATTMSPKTMRLSRDQKPLTRSHTKSFTIPSPPPLETNGGRSISEAVGFSEKDVQTIPLVNSGASCDAEDKPMDATEVPDLRMLRNVGFRRDNESIGASRHSAAMLHARDKTVGIRYSKNQTDSLRPTSSAFRRTSQFSSEVAFSKGIDGRCSHLSPLLCLEVKLYSMFTADIAAPKVRFRYRLIQGKEGSEIHTGSLVPQLVHRDPDSVSRTTDQLWHGDLRPYSSNLRLEEVSNSLRQTIPALYPSEPVVFGTPSASLSEHRVLNVGSVDTSVSHLIRPSVEGVWHLSLLSTVFFDQELKSLIDENFRFSNVPRDESLLHAMKISDYFSCILDHQNRSSAAYKHVIGYRSESQFLSNLYVEPEHVNLSNSSSTTTPWASELQKHFGKVRSPVFSNFQRRTYLNMCELDERRAPQALWHFDNSNFLQHDGEPTDSLQAQNHVAYATATNTRRYSSYYSKQGVHSSPGDTTVALNFGFQTRTNYPFRKTYLYTHRRGEGTHEKLLAPLEGELSGDALESAESPAQASGPVSQQRVLLDTPYDSNVPREVQRIDDKTPVYSISEDGKLTLRKN